MLPKDWGNIAAAGRAGRGLDSRPAAREERPAEERFTPEVRENGAARVYRAAQGKDKLRELRINIVEAEESVRARVVPELGTLRQTPVRRESTSILAKEGDADAAKRLGLESGPPGWPKTQLEEEAVVVARVRARVRARAGVVRDNP